MKQIINHSKDGGLLNMIRRTGPLITFVFIFICIMSCSKSCDMNQLIAGDSCQYWHLLTPDSDGKTKYFCYFNREGKWIGLEESYRDKIIRLSDMDDVVCNPVWKLKSDSVINLGGLDRRLEVVNDTFIIIRTEEYHWIDTLYKVTNPYLLKKLKEVQIP